MATCSVEGCEREATTHVCVAGKKLFVCSECAKSFKENDEDQDTKEILEDIHQRVNKIEETIDGITSGDKENNASSESGFVKYGER
jgi:transcription initiation factor IIE alpha subunit